MTHPSPKRNMVPKAALMRSGLVSLTTARPVNTTQPRTTVNSARPMTNVFNKAHSIVRRHINNKTTIKNNNLIQKVNTVKDKDVNDARPKAVVNVARPKVVLNAIKGNQVNAVKALACWVWKPKTKVIDHVSGEAWFYLLVLGGGSLFFRDRERNISYLTDFEEIDGGYVAFGGNPKGGKITGRATKDKTSGILKSFIIGVENLIDQRVKVIRCENGTEFKNKEMNQFCERKGKARIETVTGKDYILLPLWPADPLFSQSSKSSPDAGFKPSGDVEKKNDSVNSTNNINTASDGNITNNVNTISLTVNIAGIKVNAASSNTSIELPNDLNMPELEDIVYLDDYEDVGAEADMSTKACDDVGKASMETVPGKDYILLPLWTTDPPFSQISKSSPDAGFKPSTDDRKKVDENPRKDSEGIDQEKEDNVNSINNVNAASTNEVNVVGRKTSIEFPLDPNMPPLEDIVYSDDDEDVGAEADMKILNMFMPVSPIPTTRVHKDHPVEKIIGDLNSAPQTRRMTKNLEEHVDLPNGKRAIRTKWVFRNKKNERGIVIKNKARLVAQGYTQEEMIDYDEFFAPIARIEAIRLFLAYASFKDFVMYQMDVKSDFLYGKIEEEVYVCQPQGFEDPDFPNRVYKKGQRDILLVQVYVDDIIFGFTKKSLCTEFKKMMHKKFQMSSMGKLTFFLGLLISWRCKKQIVVANATTEAGYVAASSCSKTVNGEVQLQALMDGKKVIITESTIRKDLQLEDAKGTDCLPNADIFKQLTLMGAKTTAWNEFSSTMASIIICLARNQKFNFSKYIFESMVKNLDNAVKFWMYPRFIQVFLDNQLEGMANHSRIYIAPSHTKKIFANMRRQGKANLTDPHHTPTIIQPSTSQPQRKQRPRKSNRKDNEVPQPSGLITNVADEAVNEEMDDSLGRAATTAISLDAEQDWGGGPRRQDTMGDISAQTRFERVSKQSNDPLLAGVNTPQSGKDSLKLQELIEICTNLQQRGRIADIDVDARITLAGTHFDADTDMFGVHDLDGDEVIVEIVDVVAATTVCATTITEVDITFVTPPF
ncbi:putative ribonuclease H-like domain-containing protein [Tanacetum coccineum]